MKFCLNPGGISLEESQRFLCELTIDSLTIGCESMQFCANSLRFFKSTNYSIFQKIGPSSHKIATSSHQFATNRQRIISQLEQKSLQFFAEMCYDFFTNS